jgi:hypothetical protein
MNRSKGRERVPPKVCVECGRQMEWRKAWAKNWDQVLYCSDRCQVEARRKRKRKAGP